MVLTSVILYWTSHQRHSGDTMLKNCLKEIRMQEYMLNRREFAQLISISERQYCRYERMEAQPSLEMAFQIAKILNRNVHDIWSI